VRKVNDKINYYEAVHFTEIFIKLTSTLSYIIFLPELKAYIKLHTVYEYEKHAVFYTISTKEQILKQYIKP
jgi:hypothetical protein